MHTFFSIIIFSNDSSYSFQRGDIQRMLLASDQRRVRYVPLEIVQSLERECKLAGGLQREIQGGLGFIYPGTKWCGPGKKVLDFEYKQKNCPLNI